MGLSTHVLDTMHGTPAAGMRVRLLTLTDAGTTTPLADLRLNDDGRNPDGLLIAHDQLRVGHYRLMFDVAAYFAARGWICPHPIFLRWSPLTLAWHSPSSTTMCRFW